MSNAHEKPAELPHSKREDWQAVSPYFEKVLESARPFRGAIQACADETRDSLEKKRLLSLASDLGNGCSVDEVFDYGNDIDPSRIEALCWGSRRQHEARLSLSSSIRPQAAVNAANRNVWRTLGYPLIVILCLLIFGMALSSIIIRPFQEIFDDFGLPLPPPTRIVLGLRPYLILGVLACAATLLLWTYRKRVIGSQLRKGISFRVPVIGFIYRNAAFGKLCHIVSILIRHGAPMGPTLRIAGRATLPESLADSADRLAVPVTELGPPGTTGSTYGFPRRLVLAMKTSLDDSERCQLLSELADDFYARATHRSTAFWEPIIIILAGLAVAFIALSLFMPLLSLITNLSF